MPAKRVGFLGAARVEFDAELPPAARLGGLAAGAQSAQAQRAESESESGERLRLECAARGLPDERALRAAHGAELRALLRSRGFAPMGEALEELRAQLRVVDALLALAALAGGDGTAGGLEDCGAADLAGERLLQRALLAQKALTGRVDEGYAFGRRFMTAETFVDALERDELVAMALARGLELPKMDDKERSELKVPDRELVALRGAGAGKSLKQLTLRELVEEASAHGVDVEHTREGGANKSKRAWIDVLRVRSMLCDGAEGVLLTRCCDAYSRWCTKTLFAFEY